jgi:hypothetical protein
MSGSVRGAKTKLNTHNATQHIGFIRVLVFHAEIDQDGCFILLNGIAGWKWSDEHLFPVNPDTSR